MNSRAMIKPFRSSLIALLAGALLLSGCKSAPSPADPPLAGAAIGGPFTLVDKDGKTVRWSDFKGFYRIVYFGYTFCPDACPTDVAVAMRGLDAFAKSHPKEADRIRPIFISIDPARDTPQVLKAYLQAMDPSFVGLTGSNEQIEAAAREFKVFYQKVPTSEGNYTMDHTAGAYVFDPEGHVRLFVRYGMGVDKVTADLRQLLGKPA